MSNRCSTESKPDGWCQPPRYPTTRTPSAMRRSLRSERSILAATTRASTSKSVALAWTYAVIYGLLALLALKLMGDDTTWNAFIDSGLREEYLLLLGGPYAAAVIAKYVNVATSAGETKTSEPNAAGSIGSDAKNLVANDEGATDLGDFQYVLFNLVTLAFLLGTFIPDPREAFPDLPSLLVGLALTSAATYTAKKAASSAAGPQLASLFPTQAARGDVVDLFGRSLVADDREPMISLDGMRVPENDVNVVEQTTTRDHIKFEIPAGTPQKECRVRLTTANGVAARTTSGAEFLTLTVA
jgi:hypothetical protein